MKTLVIDSKMRDIERKFFIHNGYELVEIPTQKNIYEEVSSHVDIFMCKIGKKVIVSPQVIDILPANIKNVVMGHALAEREYPNDIKYNLAVIGKKVVHTFKYTDYIIKKYIKEENMIQIPVRQGYSRCSIISTSDNSCITSDFGIYKELIKNGVDALYVDEPNIRLLKNDGTLSDMKGFIGGATFLMDNKFILFGDVNNLHNKDIILSHIEKYGLILIDFKGLEILDYGSCMEV